MEKNNKIWMPILILLTFSYLQCSSIVGPEPEDTPVNNFEIFWKDFDLHYALFDYKNVNWDNLYNVYSSLVSENTTDMELFDILSNLIVPLNDPHITLKGMGRVYRSGSDSVEKINPFCLEIIKNKYLQTWNTAGNGYFTYGTLNDSTGYIHISSFNNTGGLANTVNEWAKDIDKVLETLSSSKRLTIDIRGNSGGSPANVEHIASRFFDQKRGYLYTRYRNGPKHSDLTPLKLSSITPGGNYPFNGEIMLLTDNNTASAAEHFTLAMRTLPYVTHLGDTTTGIFAENMERDLLNGWLYTLTHSLITSIDNICYEGIGIPPDIYIINTEEGIANSKDNALELALNSFQKTVRR
jgi:carboxyl-terminal processing protease